MNIIRINKDGSMNDLSVKINKKNVLSILKKETLSSGNNNIKELYYWLYDNKHIRCYGWYDGDCGFENKHDLIPNGTSSFLEEDSSDKLLFGDIFIIAFDNDKIVDFCVSDYAILYDNIFEGFENCSDYDSEDNNTEFLDDDTYDKDTHNLMNINKITHVINNINKPCNYNHEQLDYDINDYS